MIDEVITISVHKIYTIVTQTLEVVKGWQAVNLATNEPGRRGDAERGAGLQLCADVFEELAHDDVAGLDGFHERLFARL